MDVDSDVVLGTITITKVLDPEGGLAFTWDVDYEEINRYEALGFLRAWVRSMEDQLVEEIRSIQGDFDGDEGEDDDDG